MKATATQLAHAASVFFRRLVVVGGALASFLFSPGVAHAAQVVICDPENDTTCNPAEPIGAVVQLDPQQWYPLFFLLLVIASISLATFIIRLSAPLRFRPGRAL